MVRRGYDRIGARYFQWRRTIRATASFVNRALQGLPQDGWALDLGCGPGLPVTEALARRGRVVGVDLSATQLSMAHRNAPSARLIQADVTEVAFQPGSFDLVVAFYCLNHVPRELLGGLLGRIESWLKQGGS